ncbi:deoxyhypusine hydroxylase [Anthonomus grandis grandis]|uniref:deoxyhypusine hydroxylase n=1 Tax=Anthonomus grandis grandis TaxID=2921223 RepID=UPI0021660303|nr:deoxyhypusine hydroxylase [Anthonomus grandis grandis]
MQSITEQQINDIGNVLNNTARPLKERFRALFTLRNIGGPVAIRCIEKCFGDESALLKHELAYCLGQMQDSEANPILVKVLEDEREHPMVRHEAAEALGAIGSPESIKILESYKDDQCREVAETCQLALDRIKWLQNPDTINLSKNPYHSVDPAPPNTLENVEQLKNMLINEQESLFNRYRAMFSLRNLGSTRAIEALGEALNYGSALFKHEVAFVLGQLQNAHSIKYLQKSLEDCEENEMVRHECAEALGAIATKECMDILNKYLGDGKRVVKESCEIALDMCEYENSPEFQYANALVSA